MRIFFESGRQKLVLLIVILVSVAQVRAGQTLRQPLLLSINTVQAAEQMHRTGELVVFAAASLTEPFREIGKQLELSYPGLKVVYNFGGSSALRMQLEQGAHADVFASAD